MLDILIGDKFDPKAFPASLRMISAVVSAIVAVAILVQVSLTVGVI